MQLPIGCEVESWSLVALDGLIDRITINLFLDMPRCAPKLESLLGILKQTAYMFTQKPVILPKTCQRSLLCKYIQSDLRCGFSTSGKALGGNT